MLVRRSLSAESQTTQTRKFRDSRCPTEHGMKDAAKLLDEMLQREWKTDADLTKLADKTVN